MNREHQQTHLLIVRIWAESLGEGQSEWRGKVQHAAGGEAYYFRDWPTLIKHVLAVLQGSETGQPAVTPPELTTPQDGGEPLE